MTEEPQPHAATEAEHPHLPALPQRIKADRPQIPAPARKTAFAVTDPELLARVSNAAREIPVDAPPPVTPAHYELMRWLRTLLNDRPEGYAVTAERLIGEIAAADVPPYERDVALSGMVGAAFKALNVDRDPRTMVNLHLALIRLKYDMPDGYQKAEEELQKIDVLLASFPGDAKTRQELDQQINAVRKELFGGTTN